jgi:hypothetical protein
MAADAGKSENEMNHAGVDFSANGGQPGEGGLELTGGATEDDAPESVPPGPVTTELENTGSDDGLPNTASTAAYSDATPVSGLPDTAPVDGLPDDNPVDGPPDHILADDPADTASDDYSQYLVLDEGYEWALPPWGLNLHSLAQTITPEEQERADDLIRRLLDRIRGKPWRIETGFIAKVGVEQLRRKGRGWSRARGSMGINRGKLVKFKYLL